MPAIIPGTGDRVVNYKEVDQGTLGDDVTVEYLDYIIVTEGTKNVNGVPVAQFP
jgi:hypothetical protein